MTALTNAVSLDAKYLATDGRAYMTGIQALVRIALDRARLDRRAGLKTGGFISGYRGSPLSGFDLHLQRSRALLDDLDIVFQPGINEELGATAVWGSQKAGLSGRGSDYAGVFGLWYGKAPGVDRTGDVFKHANASGTARHGGVLAIAGDDHRGKSSTLNAQSEFAFADAEMPVLSPADIQDVLDYGLHGLQMSRHSGLWTALIALADTMDSSEVINVDLDRLHFAVPRDGEDPRSQGSVNRLVRLAGRQELEALVRHVRLPAAQAYIRTNRLEGVRFGARRPRLGLVATGKAYRDLRQALSLLGIDEERARDLGIGLYKVAMPWPLEPEGITGFAQGVEQLMVVEHKRPLIETQLKDLAYHWPRSARPPIWGKTNPDGAPFLSDILDLDTAELTGRLVDYLGPIADPMMRRTADRLSERIAWAAENAADANRIPFFCSGCPHNTSTKVPDGSRAAPGIGCHAMAEFPGRVTESLTAMGGEGATWVGAAPFSRDKHLFANLGDGTYYHSGILAIRQAVAAKVPITYKILFNDAVAMTGGQEFDGPLTVPALTRQMAAEGVERIVVVSERLDLLDGNKALQPGVPVYPRDKLETVQKELATYPGVSVLIYDQVCAAEKRRRRKKGAYDNPDRRLFINPRVCEACGDCSVQSNCLSVEPVKTAFGIKRQINQSSCNKDYSCVNGFCPSFVWVEGGEESRGGRADIDIDRLVADLPVPDQSIIADTHNMLLTGIGGMGVMTAASVLAMAGHLDGLNASTLDMTGMAQKGGAVTSQLRLAARETQIEGPRIPAAGLDLVLAGDLVVAAGSEAMALYDPRRTRAVINGNVVPTAEFTLRQQQSFKPDRLASTVREATRAIAVHDIAKLAETVLGDAIYTNMILIGFAWQAGDLPLSAQSIENAVRLNGAAVDNNLRAFKLGRVLAGDEAALAKALDRRQDRTPITLDQRIGFLADDLADYQNAAYADRYRDLIERVRAADARAGHADGKLTRIAAENLYRLMAYKDEYEVARLYSQPQFMAALKRQFAGHKRLSVALAPPLLSRIDEATGRPKKRRFGPWVFTAFKMLKRMKSLRGSRFDPFGYTAERKAERAWIDRYIGDLECIIGQVDTRPYGKLLDLARVPADIRGYGPVKAENMADAETRRAEALAALDDHTPEASGSEDRILEAAE